MAKITIKRDKCKGCLLCIEVCSGKVIVLDGTFNARGIKPVKAKEGALCRGCGMCVLMCPDCAIEIDE